MKLFRGIILSLCFFIFLTSCQTQSQLQTTSNNTIKTLGEISYTIPPDWKIDFNNENDDNFPSIRYKVADGAFITVEYQEEYYNNISSYFEFLERQDYLTDFEDHGDTSIGGKELRYISYSSYSENPRNEYILECLDGVAIISERIEPSRTSNISSELESFIASIDYTPPSPPEPPVNSTVETEDGSLTTYLVEGEIYNSITAVYPSVELCVIENSNSGIKNLLIHMKPTESNLEKAFSSYLRGMKDITLQCTPLFCSESYTNVIFSYYPTNELAELPGLLPFQLFLEPFNDKYRLVPNSIGDAVSDLIKNSATQESLGGRPLSDTQLDTVLKAFEDEKITELYNIE